MGEGTEGLLELNDQGVYEIRGTGASGGRPEAIAVNLDPVESDLAPLDPSALVASVTGHASSVDVPQQPPTPEMTREDAERRQSLWWYLLLTGVGLLAVETVIANRLSRKEKFL
jgi:hypothetical protein